MIMKKTAIVTGGTKNQFPAMAVLALNIADKCPDIADELVIFHDGVPIEEQNKVQKIFPTRFIEYSSPFNNTESGFSDTVTKYFSLMVFCKYECFKLLEEYSTVIWTDYDVLIKGNLSDLLHSYNKTAYIFTDSIKYGLKDFKINTDYCDIDFEKSMVSAALFILKDNLKDYNKLYNECIAETIKLAPYLYLPEQVVFSIVFQRFNIDIEVIDNSNNCLTLHPKYELEFEGSCIYILHAYGQPKFWNGLKNKQWNKYYYIWIFKFHGKKFKRKLINCDIKRRIKNKVKNFLAMKIKRILSDENKTYSYNFFREGKNLFIEEPVNCIHRPEEIIIGDNFCLKKGGYLGAYGEPHKPKLIIGNNCFFNYDAVITASNLVKIGNNLLAGPRIYISDNFHGEINSKILQIPPYKREVYSKGPVVIGDNVWIGCGVAILPNVTIGDNCIIGANSVVTKSFDANTVIAGNPARTIKKL